MQTSFRSACPDDIPQLLPLVESAYRGDASRKGWTTEADLLEGQRTDAQSLSELITRASSRIVLMDVGGRLMGCANLEAKGEKGYFGMFSIWPEAQGQGLGDRLLRECERIARVELGCQRMEMTVIRQRTELIHWYERRGYQATGETRPFPYGDERFGLPRRDDLEFVVFEKRLQSE